MADSLCRQHRSVQLSRREVLRAGSLGLLGVTMPRLLVGQELSSPQAGAATFSGSRPRPSAAALPGFGRAKCCILLFMWGGPAHQDTWDLKPSAPLEIRGEFKPIASKVPDIQIGEHFPRLAQRTDRLCIIRSMTHDDVNHTTSTHFLLTGQPPPPGGPEAELAKDWPHLGAVLSRQGLGREPLPPFVSMRPKLENTVPRFVEESHGQFAGWLGAGFDPLTIDADPSRPDYRVGDFQRPPELSLARLEGRRRLLGVIDAQPRGAGPMSAVWDKHRRRAFDLLAGAAGGAAFDLSQETPAMRERYGLNPHGQSVLQARRLIERGVPLVTVFWPNDGIKNVSVYWDTHSRNFIDLRERLMPVADQAFSTLLDDLQSRGLLDETLVIWTGEFGRTPRVGQRNSDAGAGRDGRDHWPNCFTTVLAGGGVKRGFVCGSSDRHAAYPASEPVQPVDLIATVYSLLGVDPQLALPDNQGRPHVICPGTPIGAVVA